MDCREIPDINLISLISPLLKPDKCPGKASSYRLVALTEVLIRMLEKMLNDKLTIFAESMGLFGWFQHGFWRAYSTASNLLEHHEHIIRNLEQGKVVECLYLDLSKALDRTSHALLIRKLKAVGFRGNL